MSEQEPPTPPPTPGTIPLMPNGEGPSLRPYREDPAIARDDRRRGRITYTEHARVARVDTVAHDLAADPTRWSGPLRHPIGSELIAEMEATLAREVRGRAESRAAAESSVHVAAARQELVSARLGESELARRRANTDVPERPVGGTAFTHIAVPLAIVPVLAYLEMRMGAPGLAAALGISKLLAESTAIAIAIGLTIAAECLGLVLGGVLRDSRTVARNVLIALAVVLFLGGAWTVDMLASGRTDNLVYRDCLVEKEKALEHRLESEESGGLATLTRNGQRSQQAAPAPTPPAISSVCRNAKPDLRFTIPLTLLAMLASTLLAVRVALAAEWREARDRMRQAEGNYRSLMQASDAAQEGAPVARQALEQSALELGAAFERETGTTTMLFARLHSEYMRWCARFGRAPQDLRLPDVPDPAVLMARMLDPGGGAQRVDRDDPETEANAGGPAGESGTPRDRPPDPHERPPDPRRPPSDSRDPHGRRSDPYDHPPDSDDRTEGGDPRDGRPPGSGGENPGRHSGTEEFSAQTPGGQPYEPDGEPAPAWEPPAADPTGRPPGYAYDKTDFDWVVDGEDDANSTREPT